MAEGGELSSAEINLINLTTPQNSPRKVQKPTATVSPNGINVARWTKNGFDGFYCEYATNESLTIVNHYAYLMNIMNTPREEFNLIPGGLEVKPAILQPIIRMCDDAPDCVNVTWFTRSEQLRSLEQIPFFVLHRLIPRILNGTYDLELDGNEGDEN